MAPKNLNQFPDENPDNGAEFEYVDADSISYVKRGRKAIANPELIEKLRNLPVGKALVIRDMKLDPKSDNYRTEKSKIASRIRTAASAANLQGFQILWSPDGIPQVKR